MKHQELYNYGRINGRHSRIVWKLAISYIFIASAVIGLIAWGCYEIFQTAVENYQ